MTQIEFTDFILDQAITWWQFTLVGILIIIGWFINLFDDKYVSRDSAHGPHLNY